MSGFERYAASGKFSWVTVLAALTGGLIAAVTLGWGYQTIIDLSPFVYVHFLLTAALGVTLGFVTSSLLKFGHTRKPALYALITLVSVVTTDLAGFRFAYHDFTAREVEAAAERDDLPLDLTDHAGGAGGRVAPRKAAPALRRKLDHALVEAKGDVTRLREQFTVWDFIRLRRREGWSLFGDRLQIRNKLATGVWAAELLILAILAYFVAHAYAARPYSEKHAGWTSPRSLGQLNEVDCEALMAAAEREDLTPFLDPPRKAGGGSATYASHVLQDDAFLSVTLAWESTDEDGTTETEYEEPITNVRLPAARLRDLERRLS